jgi:hypothetical protein
MPLKIRIGTLLHCSSHLFDTEPSVFLKLTADLIRETPGDLGIARGSNLVHLAAALHARWPARYCTAHKEIIKLTHFSQINAAAISLVLLDSLYHN